MKRFVLVFLALMLFGCGSPVYLKKFAAVVPSQGSALNGKAIFIEPFGDTVKIDDEWKESEALDDPKGFESKEPTDEEMEQWEKERDALAEKVNEDDYYKLGWQRNAFGAQINDVMSVNPPAPWLADALATELKAQGAKIVASAAEADIVVGGTLKYINIDLYVATWCNVVVDLVITPKGGSATKARIHTKGGQTAWNGSAEESYEVFVQCEQRFSTHAIDRIAKVAASAVAAEPAPAAAPEAPAADAPAEPVSMLLR